MPTRLLVGLASALTALLLAGLPMTAATAVPVNGCDLEVDDQSTACLAFDSDGDGWVDPDIELTWPSPQGIQAGASMTVSARGVDLLRPTSVGIFRDDDPTPVATLVVGPGALTASVSVPTGAAGPAGFSARAEDDDSWLYVYDTFEPIVVALASSLTSDLPPGRVVKVGASYAPVTGRVSGGARPVHLQVRAREGSWVTVATATSTTDGSYALRVPTYWVGNHTYRAHAPAFGAYGAVDGARSGSVTVKRTYKPRGSKAHAFLFGRGARWNACEPIAYAVNPSRKPSWFDAELRYALREASAATGLRFVGRGRTSHVPFHRNHDPFESNPAGIDMVFAWTTPKQVPSLSGGTVGLGGASVTGSSMYDGGVSLDATQRASRAAWREAILHELAHALGLGHVTDRRQVMYPSTSGNIRYGKGDLTGLAALGAGAGACTGEPDVFPRGATGARRAPDATVRRVVVP